MENKNNILENTEEEIEEKINSKIITKKLVIFWIIEGIIASIIGYKIGYNSSKNIAKQNENLIDEEENQINTPHEDGRNTKKPNNYSYNYNNIEDEVIIRTTSEFMNNKYGISLSYNNYEKRPVKKLIKVQKNNYKNINKT